MATFNYRVSNQTIDMDLPSMHTTWSLTCWATIGSGMSSIRSYMAYMDGCTLSNRWISLHIANELLENDEWLWQYDGRLFIVRSRYVHHSRPVYGEPKTVTGRTDGRNERHCTMTNTYQKKTLTGAVHKHPQVDAKIAQTIFIPTHYVFT